MSCRQKSQPEGGNSVLQQLSEFQSLLVVCCSMRKHLVEPSCEQQNLKVEMEFFRPRKGFLHLTCGRLFPVSLIENRQDFNELFLTHDRDVSFFLYTPLQWPFNYFGMLLNTFYINNIKFILKIISRSYVSMKNINILKGIWVDMLM